MTQSGTSGRPSAFVLAHILGHLAKVQIADYERCLSLWSAGGVAEFCADWGIGSDREVC